MAQNEITTVLKLNLEGDATSKFETAAASAKKFTSSTDRLIKNLELERIALEKGKDAMLLHKAAMEGATLDQLAHIKSTQAAIQAKKQEALAALEAANSEDYLSDEKQQAKTATDRLIQSLQIQEKEMLEGKTAALVYRAALDGATKEQQELIAKLHQSVMAQNASSQAMSAGARQARYMRGMTGQLGHQIQDVAVQMQMGTNGLLVFAQQGSQVASLMGPSGPMIGAILAVGAAIAVAFTNDTYKGVDAAEDLRKKIEELAKETGRLNLAQREFLMLEYTRDLKKQEEALSSYQKQIADSRDEIRMLSGMLQTEIAGSEVWKRYGEQIDEANDKLVEANAGIAQATNEIADTKRSIDLLKGGGVPFDEIGDSAKTASSEVERLVEGLDDYFTKGKEARLAKAYEKDVETILKAFQAGQLAGDKTYQLLQDLRKRYEDQVDQIAQDAENKRQKEARKAAQQRLKDLSDENKRLFDQMIKDEEARIKEQNRIRDEATRVEGGLFTEVEAIKSREQMKLDALREAEEAGIQLSMSYAEMRRRIADETAEAIIDARLKEGDFSELQRAQIEGTRQRAEFEKKTERDKTTFVLGELDNQLSGISKYNKKAFAIQKAVQIAQAIMNTHTAATKALAAYPPPLNAVFAALAVANGMAQVAQIKAQSFDGGGFTGIGPRSGGVDGKGGFPAILHPNETVIDHTKGQGMGGVTIVNNIDASGAGPEVDQKIVAAMEITSQQTVKQVQDLLRRQRLV